MTNTSLFDQNNVLKQVSIPRQAKDIDNKQSLPSSQVPRSVHEQVAERYWPSIQSTYAFAINPPEADVCFLTVADYRFIRGLEAFLLSLLAVYPALKSQIIIIHDGTLTPYLRNRLLSIYRLLQFIVPEPSWASLLPINSTNRKRIGILGYLNVHALSLRGYRRVIVLDSDVLIEGPLDQLWAEGDSFRLVPDCGARPWTPISALTHRPVLNSGVISIPERALVPMAESRMADLIANAVEPACPLLDRFADQKVWNQFLLDQPLELLPINLNCNSKYLFRYLGGVTQGLSVIHFAGPKPWLTWPWLEPSVDYLEADTTFSAACWLWNDRYCRLLALWRAGLYRDAQQLDLSAGDKSKAIISDDLKVLLANSDARCRDAHFSVHLLNADPDQLGGFTCQSLPASWPEPWIEALHRLDELHVWMPFEFEPLIRHLQILPRLRLHWLLIEAPFSPVLDNTFDQSFPGSTSVCFEPWSLRPIEALIHCVRGRLKRAGFAVDVLSSMLVDG